MKDINIKHLKVVLTEKKRTVKWLATEIGKDPATISKWYIQHQTKEREVFGTTVGGDMKTVPVIDVNQ